MCLGMQSPLAHPSSLRTGPVAPPLRLRRGLLGIKFKCPPIGSAVTKTPRRLPKATARAGSGGTGQGVVDACPRPMDTRSPCCGGPSKRVSCLSFGMQWNYATSSCWWLGQTCTVARVLRGRGLGIKKSGAWGTALYGDLGRISAFGLALEPANCLHVSRAFPVILCENIRNCGGTWSLIILSPASKAEAWQE